MKAYTSFRSLLMSLVLSSGLCAFAGEHCTVCHLVEAGKWLNSRHANTQTDVASELALSHAGETPAAVIAAEDCIACHAPTAVLTNGIMSEAQALGFFFTTSNGQFTADTVATNTWGHVGCATCHGQGPHHDDTWSLALFDSQSRYYWSMATPSQLCGECHGNLHFADTDHLLYNAWSGSKHNHTQIDVAGELAQSHAGETPAQVIASENCIACHSPTAVEFSFGDESSALSFFFTTTNGVFTSDTAARLTSQWPGVACIACHDPHDPGTPSYFNSTTQQYQVMTNSSQLCGQCHGNLRFPNTDHLSYNILQGRGGIGVPDQQLMGDVTCTDCHMHPSDVDGSNSKMFGGHSWAITVPEGDGSSTISCILCHTNATPDQTTRLITAWKTEFQTLDATVSATVARVGAAMQGIQNPGAQAVFAQAQHNLTYAESDESGGFHNHPYLMALLRDANQKVLSLPLLYAQAQGTNIVISWTGPGTLQSAASVRGPWSDVPGASNPLVLTTATTPQQQFYRLRP